MGAQLDRMRFGLATTPDPFRARDDAENQLLEQAALLRCIDDFALRQDFRSYKVASISKLEKIQKATNPRLPQGYIALNVLRSYQEWSTNSQERALVAIYRYLSTITPDAIPTPPKGEEDLVQAFRLGKAKRARDLCAEIYADALLALGGHVTTWNRRKQR